jgi:diketogulonate reductase-like aldo/keto reductase
MNITTKNLENGFSIPVFGIGTWMVGCDFLHNPDNDDTADIAAIKIAIEMGVRHIDTAEKYAQGHAEKLVANAIKDFDRSKLFIVSKVASENLKYPEVIKKEAPTNGGMLSTARFSLC